MEYIIILILVICTGIILKFAFGIKFENIKTIKKIGYDEELNKISNVFPENKQICIEILKQLDNSDIDIEETKNGKTSLYMIMTNKLIIADIQDTFTRIQTIAHECLHSVQNKRTLWFNFIISNIYLIYFVAIVLLTLFNVVQEPMIWTIGLILFGFIYYILRSQLETEVMSKAPYVAKKYMEDYIQDKDTELEENVNIIMENYNKLNKIGIPLSNFNLAIGVLIKVAIYCIVVLV